VAVDDEAGENGRSDTLIPERVPHPMDRMEVLKRVIKVTHSVRDLDSVLEILMDHVIELFGAERGFIMLVDSDSGALEFRTARNFSRQALYDDQFQVSRSIVFRSFGNAELLLTSNAQADERFSDAVSVKEYGLRSVMCAPLQDEHGPIGVIYADNRIRLGAFEDEDLSFLETFAAQASSVLVRARLTADRDRVKDLFSRYVSESVVQQILARPDLALTAHRKRVTVMFSDLRGFSRISEEKEPHELLDFLNQHFEATTNIILNHGGTLLSYMGDGLLAVFGAPLHLEEQEKNSILAAREMVRNAMERQVRIGVGIATGEAVLGDLGTKRRREYTVIGDVVNTAARLEKLTKEKGESILCDRETFRCSGLQGGELLGQAALDGKRETVELVAP
jgi:class 3 adenylate cyclase